MNKFPGIPQTPQPVGLTPAQVRGCVEIFVFLFVFVGSSIPCAWSWEHTLPLSATPDTQDAEDAGRFLSYRWSSTRRKRFIPD